MFRRFPALITICAIFVGVFVTPADAATRSVRIAKVPVAIVAGQTVTITGNTTGGLKGAKVTVQIATGGRWKTVKVVKSNLKNGAWTATFKAPKSTPKMWIRALSGTKRSALQKTVVIAPLNIAAVGPGGRILGLDMSRWQDAGAPIDFNRMATAGIGFAFIKGSDGKASEDALAIPLAASWAPAAKAAGILVGYYHRASIPVTTDPAVMIADAQAQAALTAARLVTYGGYDDRTLPYALDIEGIDSTISDELVTLWTFTWLDAMQAATGRAPIIYTYRSFLAYRFLQDAATINKFRNYHLWLAQPGNPADPAVKVGQGVNGDPCYYKTAWSQTDCSFVWTFWQYTSNGDRETYGFPWKPITGACPTGVTLCIPGSGTGRAHLDLNVFNGSAADLTALVKGTWNRSAAEYH